jgi:putative ATP-dependent endonuclease of OLD family
MKLSRITVENFRGIKLASVDFDDITVLIGENNSGKTSIMEAIRACLSRSLNRRANPFEDDDYHLPNANSRPGDAGPIRIVLDFAERNAGEWKPDFVQAVGDVLVFDSQGKSHITLEVRSAFDATVNDFISDWDFLDPLGKAIPKGKRPASLALVQALFPVYYLTAIRDAVRDFTPRSAFWGPFLRNPLIPDAIKLQLEQELQALNAKIVSSDPRLQQVADHLGKAQKVVSLGKQDVVSIEALPSRIWDMLSKAQVNIAAVTGANLPLAKHGAGTQSLASIFLFEPAFPF